MTTVEETISAGINSGNTLTFPSWTPGSNELVIVAVAQRHETIVPTIAGNGLTWVKLYDLDNPQAKCGIVVWRAMGASPSTGTIVITMTGNILPASAVAIRMSGTNTEGTNGSGAVEALYTNAGPSHDANDMKISITTLTGGAWALALGAHLRKSLTVPAEETAIDINNKGGTGSDYIYCSAWYQTTASPQTVVVGANGDLSGDCDWCVVGLSINGVPTSADIFPSPAVALASTVDPSILTTGSKIFELDPAIAVAETISPVVIVPIPTVPMFILSPVFQIWICDPFGNRLAFVDTLISFSAVRVVNGIGSFRLELPEDFDQSLLYLDGMVEVWRSPYISGSLRPEFVGFMRKPQFVQDSDGVRSIVLTGPDQVELLNRRIVAYDAGTAYAKKTDYIDDMMKAIVSENLGSLSTDTDRDLSGLNFTVQADASLGPSDTRSFAKDFVIDICRKLATLSAEKGTSIYFDVVPVFVSASRIGFEFRTYKNQRGAVHTYDNDNPLLFESGIMSEADYEEDYSEEENYIYAAGGGSGTDRLVVEVSDIARIGASPWNRREGFADARNAGQDTDDVTAVGNEKLRSGQPKSRFTGILKDTPQSRYGIDWDFGDKISFTFFGKQFNAQVSAVRFEINREGDQSIETKFEIAQ